MRSIKVSLGVLVTIITLSLIIATTNSFTSADAVQNVRVVYVSSTPEIHEVIGTYYNPVEGQTDSSPLITADNSKISLTKLYHEEIRWVALSRDLLKRWGGPYDYGDTLRVHHENDKVRGLWVVHDSMNKRYRKRIDFLVHQNNQFPGRVSHVLISNGEYYTKRD